MLRARKDRWQTLAQLVWKLDRLLEAHARLDAYQDTPGRRGRPAHVAEDQAAFLDLKIDQLCQRMTDEQNRVTVERLEADLARKMRRSVA